MRTMTMTALTTAILGITGIATPTTANAELTRVVYTTATNACQPATPLQLGGLRFRPLGIYNNKPYAIYISCSLDTDLFADQDSSDLSIYFFNDTTGSLPINCTAQGGNRDAGVNNRPGMVDVAAGAVTPLEFSDIDKGSSALTTINISCLLPAGVEMGLIRLEQNDLFGRL